MSTIHITQVGDGQGWDLLWSPGHVERFETAAEALRAVQARDRYAVEAGQPVAVTRIEWSWVNRVGKAVVRALASAK